MTARTTCEQMNSDMFDGVKKTSYDISSFTELEIKQAKESFIYNGYVCFENAGSLLVRK